MRRIQTTGICGLATVFLLTLSQSVIAAPVQIPAPASTPALAQADIASQPTTNPVSLKDDPRYRRWQLTLMWSLVILIAFVTAAAAIVVFSRSFRRWIGREEKAPTASDDVWAMHKAPKNLPDLDDEDETNRA